ncbi:hypothetical protein L210DRAFT_3513514 [Boletus edulis BED1]|uniref:Uncharacterized protein n=1 Tax=Boletus edulis BED1 TaxID=1328754 RepID=A0AAD4G4C0_BOLED|nr:hypothetical protein L210DRAFT_3513514 [Boletus edulis BED1]
MAHLTVKFDEDGDTRDRQRVGGVEGALTNDDGSGCSAFIFRNHYGTTSGMFPHPRKRRNQIRNSTGSAEAPEVLHLIHLYPSFRALLTIPGRRGGDSLGVGSMRCGCEVVAQKHQKDFHSLSQRRRIITHTLLMSASVYPNTQHNVTKCKDREVKKNDEGNSASGASGYGIMLLGLRESFSP